MKITKTILATGLMGLMAVAAHAQNTIPDLGGLTNENDGDLVLAFANPGSTNQLLVDIGSASDYYTASNAQNGGTNATTGNPYTAPLVAGETYTVASFNNADLSTVLGSNATSSSTVWTVFGGSGTAGGPIGEPENTLWLSSSTGATLSSPSPSNSLSTQLDTLTNGLPSLSYSHTGLSQDAASDARTYSFGYYSYLGGSNNFGYTGAVAGNTGALSSVGGSSSIELFELMPTGTVGEGPTSVNLGTFTLTNNAVGGIGLTFTAYEAIPEPSTYAAILGAMTLGFVLIRRRQQAAGVNGLV
jgi:hypothetical protein